MLVFTFECVVLVVKLVKFNFYILYVFGLMFDFIFKINIQTLQYWKLIFKVSDLVTLLEFCLL